MKRLRQWYIKQRALLCVLVLAVCVLSCLRLRAWAFEAQPDAAGPESVYDFAGLFSPNEKEALSREAAVLAETMQMSVAIVTIDDHEGSAQEYADSFYISAGLGTGDAYDGVLFLIDMDERELWITTSGKMIRYLTDSRIEAILDDAYAYISEGGYYETAQAFLADTRLCYENGIARDQYNEDIETGKKSRYHSLAWYEIAFAFFAASACGLAAVGSVVREYGMKDMDSRVAANFKLSYRKDSSFTQGLKMSDVLLGSYVTHAMIAAAKGQEGSKGSRGGFSGGGRSSTHRSGGRSFGGGGRKF
ncbi:MAG: TPM domain-containing protein [Lachnospiraceae bacterium]|nr:TPM domain-containing protein [Lachnospiraceae bacterium]